MASILQSTYPLDGKPFTFEADDKKHITDRILSNDITYFTENEIAQGIVLPQETVSLKQLKTLNDTSISIGDGIFLLKAEEVEKLELSDLEKGIIKPYYTSRQLGRYYANPIPECFLIYTDKKVIGNIENYPKIKAHLDKYKKIITSDNKPYGLHRPRKEDFFLSSKLISIRKTDRPKFSIAEFPCYVSQTFNSIKTERFNLHYLSGILNSNLIFYWLKQKGKLQGDALQIDKEPLLNIPIKSIDFTIIKESNLHSQIAFSVKRLVELLRAYDLNQYDKDIRKREIASIETKINKYVYELYNLSSDQVLDIELNINSSGRSVES